MFGFLMACDYQDWLKTLEGKRACDINKKTCQRCGHCCAKRPCIPTPRELHKIADFLGIPTKEAVKKYFLIDSFSSSPDGDKFIFPCKDTQTDITGQYIEAERTYDKGYCIFYDKIKKDDNGNWGIQTEFTTAVPEYWDGSNYVGWINPFSTEAFAEGLAHSGTMEQASRFILENAAKNIIGFLQDYCEELKRRHLRYADLRQKTEKIEEIFSSSSSGE